jgi:hypothetical protein
MNIILQHFTGELRPLDRLSISNITRYCHKIGAEYELVLGQAFREHLTPPCQKVCLLDERFDQYDNVLMLDIDMFATRDLSDNVFDIEPGIGLHVQTQQMLLSRMVSHYRLRPQSAYWGGSFYKMDRETRIKLRSFIPKDDSWMDLYNKPYHFEDEGIMAELYEMAGYTDRKYIDRRWCQCSFLPEHMPGFIHIRTKITPTGPKREKLANYDHLVSTGII